MAEDFNHIDQIIRQKFDNFEPEPPVHVWDNIKSDIAKNPPPPSSSGIILPIIVAISVLIFVSGLIHHFFSGNNNDTKAGTSTLSIQSAGVISTGSTTTSDASLQEAFYQTPSEMIYPQVAEVNTNQNEQNIIPVRAPFDQKSTGERKKNNKKKKSAVTANPNTRSGQWQPGLVQSIKAGELSYSDAVKYNLSARDIRKLSGFTDDYTRNNITSWSIGLYFNPEVTNSKDENIENSFSYNFGIMPSLNFNHFFIQSGLNMRFTHDKGNMAVDYNRYLGSYEDVYLVTFDTIDGNVIPTYFTNSVEVYDTINHYSISETKAKYTYLEIPLLLGYRHTFGKFSLFGKAGPAASFLVIKDIPEAAYPEDKARIVNVDYQIPVRSSINWQMMMGAGFDYKFAEKVSFSLEPTFRFALKPEYNLSNGAKGNTTSFGIRAGLNYNF